MELEQYTHVKQSVRKLLNIDLEHYKDEQMRRRLDSWLVRSGAPDWREYFKRLPGDPKELSRFRDYLTINVSAFYRDFERWQTLQQTIVPELLKENAAMHPLRTGLTVWSAGCSIGAEPYSLAMMLDEIPAARRHTIVATDLDRGALMKSKARGPYTADEIQNLTPSQRAAYLEPGGPPFFMRSGMEKRIDFREHNMLADPFPQDVDLILCRNVVIYFTNETKEQLYRRFHQALRPNGVLFVGVTEILPHPLEIGFRSHGISFYKKYRV
jgi:chemotaxis protein methyltransferase CheR